ncbi:carbamoyltransferase HypF [Martelella lutilitoris]|uniref:Carbamoyltransferase HypF n=1 Tax=Martelella lutilitoris TaxID=2583532 RepID=A0A5C4JL59_9HYPH|nr:carbamoyltransferase HypF [Martelella lutilitoris]TNB46256.1 carbamoyltransferase HypF [Martelella lutilitoris]
MTGNRNHGRQIHGRRYRVTGLVQGVGFRPTVWRLARERGLTGHVLNDAAGVELDIFGSMEALDRFDAQLSAQAPPLARIDKVTWQPIAADAAPHDFVIRPSRHGAVTTGVVPDAALCPACRDEIFSDGERRKNYAFANCTDCGPRLSIVRAIPYDRANTSMAAFSMCPACLREYGDPEDRRFHAEPIACPDCGPRLWFEGSEGSEGEDGDPLETAADWLRRGAIVAIKGIGGFHLACDATNAAAITRLRSRKHRPTRPLAVMVRDLKMAGALAELDAREQALMASPAAPILLARSRADTPLAATIAPGQTRVGVMLAYSPLHVLLMEKIGRPLVMTSANRSGAPLATGNDAARSRLSGIADGFLMHDREIVNRLDDSVVRADRHAVQIIRRARGFAPAPITVEVPFAKRILAMGGEMKSAFCLATGRQAIVSQHIGDLEDADTFADYRKKIELYLRLFDFHPDAIAVDCHPDYLSTQHGRRLGAAHGIPVIPVQHHHAHLASCLSENGLAPDHNILAVVLDGLGLGTDGPFWGGEILLGNCRRFVRLAHFAPVAMPGGNAASREPWRNLVAHMWAAFGRSGIARLPQSGALPAIDPARLRIAGQMTARGINAPPASSAGRLFDAVAAALGIFAERQDYEGQAAMALEALAASRVADVTPYPVDLAERGDVTVMSWKSLWTALLDDVVAGRDTAEIAARFHGGLIAALARETVKLAGEHGIRQVALTGGVMNNAIVSDGLADALVAAGLTPVLHRQLPANDGGLALGQAAIAACAVL